MKLPIYTEITFEELNQMDLGDIKKALQKVRIGTCPTYIPLYNLTEEECFTFLRMLSQACDELNLCEKFPYPLYIITDKLRFHPRFIIVPDIKFLPSHFLSKMKRPKPKEQILLNKIVVLAEKITNVDLKKKIKIVTDQAKKNRELADVCHELNAMEQMLQQLRKE